MSRRGGRDGPPWAGPSPSLSNPSKQSIPEGDSFSYKEWITEDSSDPRRDSSSLSAYKSDSLSLQKSVEKADPDISAELDEDLQGDDLQAGTESDESSPSQPESQLFGRWWEDGPTPPWEIKCSPRVQARPRTPLIIPSLQPPKASSNQRRTCSHRAPLDLFALWENGARSDTPRTAWNETRGPTAPSTSRRAWEASRKAATAAASRAPTLRAVLVGGKRNKITSPTRQSKTPTTPTPRGKHRLPEVEADPAPTHLNGRWFSRLDNELMGRIEGDRVVWAEDGTSSRINLHSDGQVVSMLVNGEAHSAVLSSDGRLLRWSDGDRWMREDDDMEILRQSTSLYGAGNDDLDCSILFGESNSCWSTRPSSTASRSMMGSRGSIMGSRGLNSRGSPKVYGKRGLTPLSAQFPFAS